MSDTLTPQELQALRKTLARANEQGWGIAFGLLGGLGLFFATIVLVLKGGPNPGPHLSLIGMYFPGYSVSWVGSVVGFVYAFVSGYAIGRTVAVLYNRLSPR
jgi:hypothetical protein